MDILCKAIHILPMRTVSALYIDGQRFSYVIEDAVREIEGVPVEKWKVDKMTAIPSGHYLLTLELSNRFGPNTLTLTDPTIKGAAPGTLRGFAGVRVHGGLDETYTEGCPCVGYELTQDKMIRSGTTIPCVEALKKIVAPKLSVAEKIWWTVDRKLSTADHI